VWTKADSVTLFDDFTHGIKQLVSLIDKIVRTLPESDPRAVTRLQASVPYQLRIQDSGNWLLSKCVIALTANSIGKTGLAIRSLPPLRMLRIRF